MNIEDIENFLKYNGHNSIYNITLKIDTMTKTMPAHIEVLRIGNYPYAIELIIEVNKEYKTFNVKPDNIVSVEPLKFVRPDDHPRY